MVARLVGVYLISYPTYRASRHCSLGGEGRGGENHKKRITLKYCKLSMQYNMDAHSGRRVIVTRVRIHIPKLYSLRMNSTQNTRN